MKFYLLVQLDLENPDGINLELESQSIRSAKDSSSPSSMAEVGLSRFKARLHFSESKPLVINKSGKWVSGFWRKAFN